MHSVSPARTVPPQAASLRETALRRAASALEESFIAEMLKAAGIGAARSEFGGGTGEDQFASMLQDRQAHVIAGKGGFGLAESIYRAINRQGQD